MMVHQILMQQSVVHQKSMMHQRSMMHPSMTRRATRLAKGHLSKNMAVQLGTTIAASVVVRMVLFAIVVF
jgi:hypothetical protein